MSQLSPSLPLPWFCLPFFPLSLLPVAFLLPSSCGKLIGQLPRWCAGFKSSAHEGEAVFNYNQYVSRDCPAWKVELWHGEAWWPAPAPPRSVAAVASCVDVPCSHQHTGRLLVRVHTGYLLVRLRFLPTPASAWVQREVLAAEAEHQTPEGNQNTDWCRQISPLIFTSNCFHCEKKYNNIIAALHSLPLWNWRTNLHLQSMSKQPAS